MLGKLFKYDFKATGRFVFPLSLLTILMTAISCGTMAIMKTFNDGTQTETVLSVIVNMIGGMLIFFSVLVLIAFVFCIFIAVVQRFYTSFFTDEGYLTFTLPVSSHSLLVSKMLSSFLFVIYGFVITFICIMGYIISLTVLNGGFDGLYNLINQFSTALSSVFGLNIITSAISYLALIVIGSFSTVIMLYFSFTVGASITQKHRIICGVGLFFAISTVISTAMSVIGVVLLYAFNVTENSIVSSGDWIITIFWLEIAVMAAVGVACYFLTHGFIKNKLNLS